VLRESTAPIREYTRPVSVNFIYLSTTITLCSITSAVGLLITPTMPSRKSRRKTTRPKSTKDWSMWPSLHDDVSELLRKDDLFFDFYKDDDDINCINEYDTNIMGRFKCNNSECPKRGWASKRIPITIRMYSNQQYNARVYYQRCKSCNTQSEPELDESYADRIAYRLKKWSGLYVERRVYTGKSKAPHRSDLCEGCKHGHCSMME
jgi:hypothetical protein